MCHRSQWKGANRQSAVSLSCRRTCAGNGWHGGDEMPVVSLLFHDVFAASPRESGFESPAADRYKLSVRTFEAQLEGLARVEADAPHALAARITFDDGGASYYTIAAERLEARGWRGHCFVSTDFINQRGFLTAGQLR